MLSGLNRFGHPVLLRGGDRVSLLRLLSLLRSGSGNRVNSRQRNTSVAFGAKRTLTEPRGERPNLGQAAPTAIVPSGERGYRFRQQAREIPGRVGRGDRITRRERDNLIASA